MVAKARIQKRLFEVEEGDLITYLNVYNGYIQSEMSQGNTYWLTKMNNEQSIHYCNAL